MTLAKPTIAILAVGAISALSQSAIGQPYGGPDFVIVMSHIDNVRQQTDPLQVGAQCANNPMCMAVAKAATAATGVPIDKIVVAAAALATKIDGEGTYMTIGLPAGYAYCSSSMRLTSIVPHDGDRGSTFLGRADANGLYSETWTPVRPWPEGRSWVEGDLAVVGIKAEKAQASYASGECHAPGRAVFYCRGGGCDAGAVDKGQSVSTSSPPGAGSRN